MPLLLLLCVCVDVLACAGWSPARHTWEGRVLVGFQGIRRALGCAHTVRGGPIFRIFRSSFRAARVGVPALGALWGVLGAVGRGASAEMTLGRGERLLSLL